LVTQALPAVDDPVPATAPSSSVASLTPQPWWRSAVALNAALVAILVLPLLVALVALHSPRWFPILDLAMTELRVRDVGSSHTPLIGLPGRIGNFGAERGSHPGPLSFWLLAPTYRLFGASAWAMEVGAVVLHTVATSLALWFARRRGGVVLMVGVALALALLMRCYGADVLTQPWNPYMPVSWWFVVLLTVWSVLCGDLVALPVAVFAASFCAQTHLPYVPLAGGMAALALVGVGMAARNKDQRPRVLRWVAGSAVLGALLWLPVVIDQVSVEPANLTLIARHFQHPPEAPVGLRRGVEMVLLHLDPWRFASGNGIDSGDLAGASSAPTGSYVPGLAVLVAWLAAAVAAWRLRHQVLLRLHAVVGVGLLLAAYSISRVFGLLWFYLMLWAFGITALTLTAIGWTAVELLRRRAATADAPAGRQITAPWVRPAVLALSAAVVVSSVAFALSAAHVQQPAEELSQEMGGLTPSIVSALSSNGPYEGRNQRYLVTWTDAVNIGAEGISLVNELERSGFDVGVVKPWSVHVSRFRYRPTSQATASVQLATGEGPVRAWRGRKDAVEIASYDPRNPAQRAEFATVRARLLAELHEDGLDAIVPLIDENLFLAAIDARLTDRTHRDIDRLLAIGQPSAAFVGPATMSP